MQTQKLFSYLIFLFIFLDCSSQGFQVKAPKLQFDGSQLRINYDIVGKSASDQFYVWVEMEKKNGEQVRARSFTGDVGENIKAGPGKTISWIPSNDSVYLNEEILVEVKAEKYIKSYNKGSMFLLSALVPGLGQSRIKGKPYWISGLVAYGTLAGGIIMRSTGNKDYDTYLNEENPITRRDLLDKAQKKLNTSSALLITSAAVWTANLIWVAAIPEKYQPLKNARLSFEKSSWGNTNMIALRFNF